MRPSAITSHSGPATAAGHPVGQEPYDAFFGSRDAIVIDPDGDQVGLKSPIEDDRRYVPEVEPAEGAR